MARLKKQHDCIASSEGPLAQPAATRAARQHPDVVKAQEAVDARVRALGHDPSDPRWILSDSAAAQDPEYQRLAAEHDKAFSRVRGDYMR